ncbi:MAG: molybdopterin molybdotransferase MoeA [SAR324 cluster bacterium]|nr:molybdopterin molybdotransferase MoeA [SAR324 cluster bacterium]MBL7034833.1 molybdopterin molybdotransferase MoeA [SAR324 cluster bacterium]
MTSKADIRMRGFLKRTAVKTLLSLIMKHSQQLSAEEIPTVEACGRVLVQDIVSPANVPNFDRSAMDGYALDAESTFGASEYNPLMFQVVGQVTPGESYQERIQPGEALSIMTGGPLPKGTNAVLMAEHAERDGDQIQVLEAVAPGKHVGQIGEDVKQNQILLKKGRCLRPQDIAVLASVGLSRVEVVRKPVVELLITGNELLKPGAQPSGVHIIDSNSVMLTPLIERDGAVLKAVHQLPDERALIRQHLRDSTADLICMTGGTSVGIEDHGPTLVEELGELLVHGIPMRPAAPTGFGLIAGTSAEKRKKVFLLPGNPVSCLSAYDYFVGRALRLMGGRSAEWPYRTKMVKLATKISSEIGRIEYVRLRIEDVQAFLIAAGGASILSSTTLADGFLLTEEDSEGYAEGEEVQVWLYDA